MKNQFIHLDDDQQQEFLSRFYDLFAGRLEFYAIRKEGKDGERAIYVPSTHESVKRVVRDIGTHEFTEDVVRAHLEGRYLIGVYPINKDSNVRFFALDFDGKDGDPWEEAVAQAKILTEEAGLHVYIERSQSGNGYHVWGFIDSEMNAGMVRHALSPFIEKVETFDRMFPNQAGISPEQPYGNLIALPLAGCRVEQGNSVFVRRDSDGNPEPVPDQIGFIQKIRLNSVAKIKELFEAAGEYTPPREIKAFEGEVESLGKSWKLTHPVFGCEFWRWGWERPEEVTEPLWYAMACNLAQLENGRELFHAWSARDKLRYNPIHTDKKYDQALRQNKPHSCETIRALGGNCRCDERFPGKVWHPFDLVKLPTSVLIESVELDEEKASQSLVEGLTEVYEWLEQVVRDPTVGRGLTTSIPEVSRHFGYRDGELTILAARNSIGKTAIALQEARVLAEKGLASAKIFSLEMTKRQVYTRILSPLSGVTQTRMATGQLTESDWEAIRDALERANEIDLHVDDTTSHLDSIIESAAEFVLSRQAQGERAVIFIDYLQIIPRLPRENEQEAVARSVTALKRFAKALNTHVVLLCQLNRGADDATTDSKTYDSWLRGCLTGDTEIIRADTGAVVTIGDLARSGEKNIPIWTMDDRGRIVPGIMTEAWSTGVKPVFKLRLASGREIQATANHPFFKLSGWTELKDLRVGDRIAVTRRIGESLHTAQVLDDPYLLDLATSDLFWDEVVSIEYIGEQEVFDGHVPGTHNFVANSIVVHNSGVIEFVADNILILLGEKGPGVVERTLTIHKQRNGEAGITLPLEFNQPFMLWGYEGSWGVTVPDPTERDEDDLTPLVDDDEDDFSDYDDLLEGL